MKLLITKVLPIFITVILMACILAWPTMLLWNWLMPKLFGLITINFWEAMGLCFMLRFLFGGNSVSSSK